jgi:hypothetical protein
MSSLSLPAVPGRWCHAPGADHAATARPRTTPRTAPRPLRSIRAATRMQLSPASPPSTRTCASPAAWQCTSGSHATRTVVARAAQVTPRLPELPDTRHVQLACALRGRDLSHRAVLGCGSSLTHLHHPYLSWLNGGRKSRGLSRWCMAIQAVVRTDVIPSPTRMH